MSWLRCDDDWGLDLHGGPHYRGHCPVCGCSTGTHDCICDECEQISVETEICPQCGLPTIIEQYDFEHDCCDDCVKKNAERFTQRFLNRIKTL